MKPMLARPANLADAEAFLTDDAWLLQQKLDGQRLMLVVSPDGAVTPLNRAGDGKHNPPAVVVAQAAALVPLAAHLGGAIVVDGELIGLTYHVFDLPVFGKLIDGRVGFADRYAALARIFADLDLPAWSLVPLAVGTEAKRALWAALKANRAEGAIVKRADGAYAAGKRTTAMMKLKLWKSVDCIVTAVRDELSDDGSVKDSMGVSVYRDDELVEIGRVTLLGKEKLYGTATVGTVVEVKYLKVEDGNVRLCQTEWLGVRDDKHADECTIDQLVLTNKEVVNA